MSEFSPAYLLDLLVKAFDGKALGPLVSFESLFPEETSWPQIFVRLPDEAPKAIANKIYHVVDLHCQVPSCECHKVSLAFVDQAGKVWATVSYGWRSKKFYRQWGLDKKGTQELVKGFLDPYAQQSEMASYFFEEFQTVFKNNPPFMTRLKERYAFLKKNLKAEPSRAETSPQKIAFPENVVPFKPFSTPK